ncbi:MAG: hypothetical protein DRO13_01380, partial [Thermoprotei archaeon]
VIATVIIVAVAITIAIAVAFWMTGIVGAMTRFEKLEIPTIYAVSYDESSIGEEGTDINGDGDSQDTGWMVVLQVKNTGTSDTTIDQIYINGKPYDYYNTDSNIAICYASGTESPTDVTEVYSEGKCNSDNNWNSFDTSRVSLKSGGNATIVIVIQSGGYFNPGMTIEVKLHTSAGNEYPKQVQLP